MKHLLLYLLLCMAALFSGFQLVDIVIEENVIEADVVYTKTGVILSVNVPEQFLTENGQLNQALEIELTQKGKIEFALKSLDLNISLPSTLYGNYSVIVRLGNLVMNEQICI